LPLIIFSQFTGSSLWFAGNAVIGDLQLDWGLGDQSLAYITSAVQLGFICGTLLFALLLVADRFSPRKVFFCCSLAGAIANVALLAITPGLAALLILRFSTGFFLAGIYPVGMKIAAGWYRQGLGRALGYLVGALVVGTAFPHLIRAALATGHYRRIDTGHQRWNRDVAGGTRRPAAVERIRVRSARTGFDLSLAPFSRLGFRLLRAHVGTVHAVGLYSAVAAGLCDKSRCLVEYPVVVIPGDCRRIPRLCRRRSDL
jgi:MFS family permease